MVGQIIKRYIRIMGITVAEVAEGADVEQARLEAMLNGKEPIGLEDYATICGFLGVPIDTFTKGHARDEE